MTDHDSTNASKADRGADMKAIAVIFVSLVLMAIHFVSGFTFDF